MEEKIISMEKYLISKKHKNIKSKEKVINEEELKTISEEETDYQKELILNKEYKKFAERQMLIKKTDEKLDIYIAKRLLITWLLMVLILAGIITFQIIFNIS